MKIVLVIPSLDAGGAERVLSNLANHWAACSFPTSKISNAPSTSRPQALTSVTILTLAPPSAFPFYPLDQRISLIQLDCLTDTEALSSRWWHRLRGVLRRLHRLRSTLKALNPDVVISFVDIMNLTTLLATLGLRVPVVVSERTHPAHYELPSYIRRLQPIFYKKAKAVVCQTASAASFFRYLKNVTIIPNPIKYADHVAATSCNARRIVSAGRLIPSKGLETLLRSFATIAPRYPDATLTIYGEGPDRHRLESLIRGLNLTGKAFLPGVTADISKALSEADLFIFPSLFEGFPNALCEAMAAGLPVIASDCSGSVDIVRDGIDGRLFPVGNGNRLTALIQELLEDAPQRQRLAKAAQEITSRFHPDKIYGLWDDLLTDVLSQEKGNRQIR